MNINSRLPRLNLYDARRKQMRSFEKNPEGGSGGSLSPNLQPPTPPICPDATEPFTTSRIGSYLLLGQQEGSMLYRCIHVLTQEEFVCKIVAKDSYERTLAGYLRLDGQPQVNRVEEVLVGTSRAYIFFPRSYEDLHSYVRSKRRLKEQVAVPLFRQVVQAVQACHDAGVVLRDLKLRKFVFKDPERTQLKLETLDDAVVLDDESSDQLSDRHGCPAYVSPEILTPTETYSGKAADCWSLGVILYTLLVGRYPFNDSNHTYLIGKIRRGKFTIPDFISLQGKCLIRNLLRKDPKERFTVEEVLSHPWLQLSFHEGRVSSDNHKDEAKVPEFVMDATKPAENPFLFLPL
ncbi:tribbles homolog 2-like [Limulus polyphemus]|uniref:Tribbles homolog 2-like n=1 Tax=Limulus polyphemus TaxID=6850 RepID=A0ABM1BR07_LIMPO|nr:tribbles homolog 2-like [Limulus polyphemus]XP_013786981.1 tribbles homolog 2-like [Limulus polyphemus]